MRNLIIVIFVFATGFVHATSSEVAGIQAELSRKLEKSGIAADENLAQPLREASESLAQAQVSEQAPAPAEYSMGCVQVRGAAIFAFGGQLGVAACSDGSNYYVIRYLTPNVNGFPLTIGAGGGVTAGLFYVTSDSLDFTGRYSCSHEGAAFFAGAAALQCSGKGKDGKPRSLSFWGGNVGFQAELGIFPIEID